MRTTSALRGLAAAAILPAVLVACTPPDGNRSTQETATPVPTESSTATGDSESESGSAESESTESESGGSDGESGAVGSVTPEDTYAQGLPAGVSEAPESATAGASWSEDGSELYVVTFGSSSCPLVAQSVQESTDGALEVTLVETGGAVCTMDYTPTTTTVSDLGEVDPSAEHEVTLGELGALTLPAASDSVSMTWVSEDSSPGCTADARRH